MSCGKTAGDLLREYEKADAALRVAMPKVGNVEPGGEPLREHVDLERIELITRLQKYRDDLYEAWKAHVA